jgi:glycosyltransferase involved in cell wall biosynthesis
LNSILIIIPYEAIYPPINGGMQRCFNILYQLAKYFDVTAIISQDKKTFLESGGDYPEMKNVKVYSTRSVKKPKDIFSFFPEKIENALRYRWIKKSLTETTDSKLLEYYPLLKKILKKQSFDAVILENLSTINATDIVRKYGGNTKIIYDAHNVDSNLSMGTAHLPGILKLEKNLYAKVDAMFTCSEKDRADFLELNQHKLPVAVIPNGVNVGRQFSEGVLQNEPEYIIFCGALWTEPNREGLLWFYNKIWAGVRKAFPDLKLLVVGSGQVPNSFQPLLKDSSLVFTGAVDDVKPWYNKAAVSIVPLLTGSGTRLKILEAMSYGLPVVSTSKGAEGIDYTNGEDIVIADDEKEFSESLKSILIDKQKRISISENGRILVTKQYDWNVIGKSMDIFINKIIKS